MFAAKVTKSQTNATSRSTASLAGRSSTLLTRRTSNLTWLEPSCDREQQDVREKTTPQEAPRGLSWDFSKIPVFPPEPAGRPQRSVLPGAVQAKLMVGQVDDPLEREA